MAGDLLGGQRFPNLAVEVVPMMGGDGVARVLGLFQQSEVGVLFDSGDQLRALLHL